MAVELLITAICNITLSLLTSVRKFVRQRLSEAVLPMPFSTAG
jgi:hypothetical protein